MEFNYRMEIVKEKEAETTEECETARKKARKARQLFEKVKADRYKRFQECFEPVAQKIDEIYKVCRSHKYLFIFVVINIIEIGANVNFSRNRANFSISQNRANVVMFFFSKHKLVLVWQVNLFAIK